MTTTKGKFALDTTVKSDRTLAEIRELLKRYGGGQKFGVLEDETQVKIAFTMNGRALRFSMPLPEQGEAMVAGKGSNQYITYDSEFSPKRYQQLVNARWRALLLVIKAKLESVELGVETFEESFMAQLVMPSGQTAAEWFVPQYQAALETGQMPPLLPSGS